MKRALIVLLAAFLFSGCKSLNRITGSEKKSEDKAHQLFVVACCRDVNAGVMTYPPFLPASHVQLCETVRNACLDNDCQINGDTWLAMGVDCDPKFGHIGSEYYAGKGY